MWGSFSTVIRPTYTKFHGHIGWWLAINTVALGFLIFLPAAERLSCEMHRWFAKRWPTPHLFAPTFLCDCSTDPHQIRGECSQIAHDEPNCFQFPIFPNIFHVADESKSNLVVSRPQCSLWCNWTFSLTPAAQSPLWWWHGFVLDSVTSQTGSSLSVLASTRHHAP